jgi:quinol monooxygenase YgiN
MTKVALFIKIKTKPGKRDEVRELWEKFLKGRAEAKDAQELYFFCNDNNDADAFLLFVVYSAPVALAKNATTKWFAAYMESVGPLLDGMPEVYMKTPVWAKGATV